MNRLRNDFKSPTVLDSAPGVQRHLDALLVVPAEVEAHHLTELLDGRGTPFAAVAPPCLQAADEASMRGIVRS